MPQAALYLRSSKDRSDLSIDAQRRSLLEHARDRGLAVVAEYEDAVESGKDDDRPGFQRLLAALKDRARGWDTLLALDTSRIARRRHLALIFEHEAERAGVAIQYKNVPDTDPITGMLLRSILQAMDEWHSLTSRAKGLAGMAESVRQGYRAGGRAPRGYRLEHQPTGAIREGMPVIRSKLVPADDAQAVGQYLRLRAQGKPRGLASSVSGIEGSLNDLEWRALTYSGHTVWNQAAERGPSGYKGGEKYRPRTEWQIQRNTHPPLITEPEAEAILAQLQAKQGRRNRAGDRVYLLSGLLVSPDGQAYSGEWYGGAGYYRLGKGAKVKADTLDHAILAQVFADLASPMTAARIAQEMRRQAAPQGKPRDLSALRKRLADLDRKAAKLLDLLVEAEDAAPAYRRAIAQCEQDRAAVQAELEAAAAETRTAEVVALWTPSDVQRLLTHLREDLEQDGTEAKRRVLTELLERVEFDANSREATLHYRLDMAPVTGVNLASPGVHLPAPVTWASALRVARRSAR